MSFLKKRIRTSHLVITGHLMAVLLIVATCDFRSSETPLTGVVHFSGQEFAGAESCRACHASIVESHAHTPHFLTSAQADTATVRGSLHAGQNILVLSDRLRVVMEQSDSGIYQHGIVGGTEVEKKRMDIVVGSGRKGQTYLYWHGDALFQLPASYYTASDSWSNSPGYPPDRLVFDRSIPARCLECHSTFLRPEKSIAGIETFDRNQMMLGVGCERCHGPAADHVRFHREHPDTKEATAIINPANLNRQQKLDNCALCHSGIRENLMPSFSYMVGEKLEDYSFPSYPADSGATLDVHGNQYGLLLASKCFKNSNMDCSSCHDVHVKETNQLGKFSARCMTCHAPGSADFCKQPEIAGLDLEANCVDCHMPSLPSRQVFVRSAKDPKPVSFFARTHLIGIYDQKVEEYLQQLGAN